jgi:uncharacterized DUF497 family protein
MRFEWDEAKNRANIRKHGFDFGDAEVMFRGLLLVSADTEEDYGEARWRAIGSIGERRCGLRGTEYRDDSHFLFEKGRS